MPYQHFSIEEREQVQYGLWEKQSVRAVARLLGRSPSSVSREINRNVPLQRRQYTPRLAHERAEEHRHHRGRIERLKNDTIRSYVRERLHGGYSPEQISGRLPSAHPGQTISPEAIYQFVYAQFKRRGYGQLIGEDFRPYLKRRHKRRIPKGARRCQRTAPPRGISIDARPRAVNERRNVGHWEGDLMVSGKSRAALQTLVERKTGLVLISKVPNGTKEASKRGVARRFGTLPASLRQTLTLDRGSENAWALEADPALGLTCYFAHPYSAWERGTNENTNGLIRWYFPKGIDFATIPEETIAGVERVLNGRPRKRLGWRTPLEVFADSVALTC